MLPRILDYVHDLVSRVVRPGDVVIDATAGNGYDTAALASHVGPGGRVHAFDVQEAALEAARRRLEHDGLLGPVRLHLAGHEHLAEVVPDEHHGAIRAVMFNLGYLPRSDKSIITRPETTVAALTAATDVLAPGGIVTVVCYTGHEGGPAEAEAVEAWATGLDQADFRATKYHTLNQDNHPPHAIILQKRP